MAADHTNSTPRAYLLGLLGVMIFGSTLPVTERALAAFSPEFITFARGAIGIVAASAVLSFKRVPYPKGDTRDLFLAGAMTLFGFPLCMALALETVPSSHGGVVLGILPLLTAAFAAIIANERLPIGFWIFALLGTIVVTIFSLLDGAGTLSAGDLWLALSALCASYGYVLYGRLTRRIPGWQVVSWALIVNSPLVFFALYLNWPETVTGFPTIRYAEVFYLGLFSQFIGFFAWNSALAMGGIARIGQLQLFQTFFTLIFAALLLGEEITYVTWLFAGAVVMCVALGRSFSKTKVKQTAQ